MSRSESAVLEGMRLNVDIGSLANHSFFSVGKDKKFDLTGLNEGPGRTACPPAKY